MVVPALLFTILLQMALVGLLWQAAVTGEAAVLSLLCLQACVHFAMCTSRQLQLLCWTFPAVRHCVPDSCSQDMNFCM
jgi:hypothetical protein